MRVYWLLRVVCAVCSVSTLVAGGLCIDAMMALWSARRVQEWKRYSRNSLVASDVKCRRDPDSLTSLILCFLFVLRAGRAQIGEVEEGWLEWGAWWAKIKGAELWWLVAGAVATAEVEDGLSLQWENHLFVLLRIPGELLEAVALFQVLFWRTMYYLISYFFCSFCCGTRLQVNVVL